MWKMNLSLAGLGAIAAVAGGASAAQIQCPTCALGMRQDLPTSSLVGSQNSATLNLGKNVASVLSQSRSPLAFAGSQPFPAGTQAYTGQGDLPNAFVRPWNLASSDFDPSFKTDFYTTQAGLINVPDAPWNLFLPPAIAESAYFQALPGTGPTDMGITWNQQKILEPTPGPDLVGPGSSPRAGSASGSAASAAGGSPQITANTLDLSQFFPSKRF